MMPRRSKTIGRDDIPLFLAPHVIMRRIRTHGDKLRRVFVRKIRRHFSNVGIRTRSIKRELKGMQIYAGSAVPVSSGEGSERV
jgi:hypothetical protein